MGSCHTIQVEGEGEWYESEEGKENQSEQKVVPVVEIKCDVPEGQNQNLNLNQNHPAHIYVKRYPFFRKPLNFREIEQEEGKWNVNPDPELDNPIFW